MNNTEFSNQFDVLYNNVMSNAAPGLNEYEKSVFLTKAQNEIKAEEKQYMDEIQRASDELNKKYAAFQEEQANLPQNIKDRRMKELQELNEKGMQFQQDAQQQLNQSWMQKLEPIAKKIDDAIKAVGQEGGYVYIFDLNSTNIPYVSETLSTDVTGAVKAKLGLQ